MPLTLTESTPLKMTNYCCSTEATVTTKKFVLQGRGHSSRKVFVILGLVLSYDSHIMSSFMKRLLN